MDPKFGGHVAAPQLSSEVVQRAEVFIKDSNGRQHVLELSNLGIPLTEGNEIIAVMDTRWNGKPHLLYLENVDTGMSETSQISTGIPQRFVNDGFGMGLVWGSVACLSTLVLGENTFMNVGWFFSAW